MTNPGRDVYMVTKHFWEVLSIITLETPELTTFFLINSLILKSIVGKKVDVALRNLSFSDKRISNDVSKTLSSAIANAENNYQYDIDKLVVKEAYCGKQIVMKRFRPRAKGRASAIKKPYSRVTIILEEKNQEKKGDKK